MLNKHIVSAPHVLFLGAGASKPLGKMLMGEFIEHLKELPEINQFGLFHDIIRQRGADLEVLLQELSDIVNLQYLEYGLSHHSTLTGPPLPPHLGIPAYRERSFPEIANTASALVDGIEAEVFNHYRRFEREGDIVPTLLPVLEKLAPKQDGPLVVFTTNYDPAIERCCQLSDRFQCVDGFVPVSGTREHMWSPTRFGQFSPSSGKPSLILFKLHGSTTWMRMGGRIIDAPPILARDDTSHSNVLIYPATRKVAIHDPYFTAYCYLQECLSHAKYCLVVGYSFRDYDAQTRIKAAAIQNPALRVEVLDPAADSIAKKLARFDIKATPIADFFGPNFDFTKLAIPDVG